MTWFRYVSTLLFSLLLAMPALAQEGLLDGDPMLEGQLEERKATKKIEEVDPDAKLLAKVKEKQEQMEALMNKLGEAGAKFAKIEKGANKLSGRFVKAQDAYLEKHSNALDAYQQAHAQGDEKAKKTLSKKIVKLRKTYLKKMKKIRKSSGKLEKQADKLQAKIDAGKAELGEEGEDAKE